MTQVKTKIKLMTNTEKILLAAAEHYKLSSTVAKGFGFNITERPKWVDEAENLLFGKSEQDGNPNDDKDKEIEMWKQKFMCAARRVDELERIISI